MVDKWYYIWYYEEVGMDLYEKIKRNKRNVTPKQLIEVLEYYGFEYKGTEGDHAQYKKQGYGRFTVPVSQNPLAIHIVQNALRKIEEIKELEE